MTPLDVLQEVLDLLDEGLLVRNTTNDAHFPTYLKEAARIVFVLAQARRLLDEREGPG